MRPTLDPAQLAREAERLRSDGTGAFCEQLHARTKGLVEDGRFAAALIALETLESVLMAQTEGVDQDRLRESLPFDDWATVPTDMLMVLIEGWQAYKTADSGRTFGECLDLEGGGQGRLPQRGALQAYNKEKRLSAETAIEYLGGKASWEDAALAVADREEAMPGSSGSSVRRASQRHRPALLEDLAAKKIIK